MLDISTFPTVTQLTYFPGIIQHCVTVVGKCIFDSNIPFDLSLTCDNLDLCFTTDDETKLMNGSKGVLKYIRLFPTKKKTVMLISKGTDIMFDVCVILASVLCSLN